MRQWQWLQLELRVELQRRVREQLCIELRERLRWRLRRELKSSLPVQEGSVLGNDAQAEIKIVNHGDTQSTEKTNCEIRNRFCFSPFLRVPMKFVYATAAQS